MYKRLLDHFKSLTDNHTIPDPLSSDIIAYVDMDLLLETGQMFVNYKVLPYAGGWLDQPHWWVTAMQTIYLPGYNRAQYDSLPDDAKKLYHPKQKTIVIPEGGEW